MDHFIGLKRTLEYSNDIVVLRVDCKSCFVNDGDTENRAITLIKQRGQQRGVDLSRLA